MQGMKLQNGCCYYSPYAQCDVWVTGPNAKGYYTTDTGMDYHFCGTWIGGGHKLEEIPLDIVSNPSVNHKYVAALESIVGSEGCKMLKELIGNE